MFSRDYPIAVKINDGLSLFESDIAKNSIADYTNIYGTIFQSKVML